MSLILIEHLTYYVAEIWKGDEKVVCSCFRSLVSRLKSETGVSIRIPPDNTNSNIIRIEGSPEGVARAKQELIEMVEKMVGSHQVTFTVKV